MSEDNVPYEAPSTLRLLVALGILIFWGVLVWIDKDNANWTVPLTVHLLAIAATAFLLGGETLKAARGLLMGGSENGK